MGHYREKHLLLPFSFML